VARSIWLAIGATASALALPALIGGGSSVRPAVVFAAVAAIVAVIAMPRRYVRLAIPIGMGAAAIAVRLVFSEPGNVPAQALPLPTGDGPWTAVVNSVSAPRDGSQPAVLSVRTAGMEIRCAATLPRYPEVRPADRVVVRGSLRPPPDDEYGRYLDRIDVVATLRVTGLERVGPGDDPIGAARMAAGDALTKSLPEPEAGLAAGILIGLRERVDRALAADFTTAGVSHVVAISGWNIAIVASAIGALAGRASRRRRTALILAAVVAYVVFAGGSPSVVRAGLMAGVVLLARESGRAGAAATALGWAAVILLLGDPGIVGDPGFGLSTVATAGLLAWGTPAMHALERLRLPGPLAESLGVSLAAQVATLPLVLLDFGRLSLVAPLVNLVVVPLIVPAMAGGGVALAAGLLASIGLGESVAALAAVPGWLPLHVLVWIVHAGANLPGASLTIAPPTSLLLALGTAAAVLVLGTAVGRGAVRRLVRPLLPTHGPRPTRIASTRRHGTSPTAAKARFSRAERVVALVLVASIGALVVAISSRPDGRVRLTVLDVGQGDAILLEGDRGERMLVDGGPEPNRLLAALDGRFPPWDRRLDIVVLTHPHEDHVAGLPVLLERYRVGRLYEPGMRGPGPGYKAFDAWLAASGRTPGRLSTGDRLDLDSVGLTVLWPDPGAVPAEPPDTGTGINNVSIVFLGRFGDERFLLAGDIEQQIDPLVLARGLPHVEVLKVAHHGSRTSSTDAFLDATRPRIAIASAGVGNPYGHPAPRTIERLIAHGALVLRTDRNGSVTVTLDGRQASVVQQRGSPETSAEAAADLRAARTAGTDGLAATTFGCGIPRPELVTSTSTPASIERAGVSAPLGYHRDDDRSRADARRPDPPGPATA
jgi:competence protein ComEC